MSDKMKLGDRLAGRLCFVDDAEKLALALDRPANDLAFKTVPMFFVRKCLGDYRKLRSAETISGCVYDQDHALRRLGPEDSITSLTLKGQYYPQSGMKPET